MTIDEIVEKIVDGACVRRANLTLDQEEAVAASARRVLTDMERMALDEEQIIIELENFHKSLPDWKAS
jgi:hypothetical protein